MCFTVTSVPACAYTGRMSPRPCAHAATDVSHLLGLFVGTQPGTEGSMHHAQHAGVPLQHLHPSQGRAQALGERVDRV